MIADEREIWLRSLVTRISGNSAENTGLDEDLNEAAGLDSLGRLEVLAEIENEFDFFFEDNQLIGVSTLAMMLDAIEEKLKDAKGAET